MGRRPKLKPPAKLAEAKRRRKDASPEIVTKEKAQSVQVSESEPNSPSPDEAFTVDQLQKFMLDWPSIPPEEHDSILFAVLESAVHDVGLGDENVEEIYSFFINTIPIRGAKNQASAFVAFCSFQKKECSDLGELILKSLVRSMRLALTEPLDSDDILFLVNRLPQYPVRYASVIEALAMENTTVRTDHLRIPDDAKILETATEIVPVGFKNALDLLGNPKRIDVNRRNCVRQVKMLLDDIFVSHPELIGSHGRAIAEVVTKLQFCPASALPTVKILAQCAAKNVQSKNKNFATPYALALILVSYLDVIPSDVAAGLPEIITLLTSTYVSGTRMLKDLLGAFREVFRNSICSDQQDLIQSLIMEKVVFIIQQTDTYEGQLEIIGFLEELSGSDISTEVFATFCERAEGLGIINRICALLPYTEELKDDGTIRKAIENQLKKRRIKPSELKIEHPKLSEYMRQLKS